MSDIFDGKLCRKDKEAKIFEKCGTIYLLYFQADEFIDKDNIYYGMGE